MNTKQDALAQILAITQEYQLSLEEISSALGKQQIESNKKNASNLMRVFSYLGGIFILAGLSGYIAMVWESLNSTARIIITLGPGITCMIMAAVSSEKGIGKNTTVLVILSAFLQATGLFVAVYEFSTGGGDFRLAAFLIFGILGMEYGLFFRRLKRTSLLFFTLVFSYIAFVSVAELLHLPDNLTQLVCGVSMLAISYGIQRTPYNSICGFGYFISSIILLWMGYDVLKHTYVEILFMGIACFMLYVSTIVRSRSILATSVIAMFSYISYFTTEHFARSIGWPICLILLGFVFFGMGNIALKINRRIA